MVLNKLNRVGVCHIVAGITLLLILLLEFHLYSLPEEGVARLANYDDFSKIDFSNTLDSSYVRERYLVDSSNCKIPDLNPFDRLISRFVQIIQPTKCSTSPPLTRISYNPITGQHRLHIDVGAVSKYSRIGVFSCCVSEIYGLADRDVLGQCVRFNGSWILNKTHEFLSVYCYNSGSSIIYKNFHASVIKTEKKKQKRIKDRKKVNVLLIGLDSISRLNLYRTMPKTVTHLHTHGWTEMRGYTKVADNTLPNLMALLTGLPPNNFQTPHKNYFDSYPFIWKDFSAKGYVTAYAEDNPYISMFNCHLKGFKHPPTDHYPRSFFLVGESLFFRYVGDRGCLGFKSSSEHLFQYLTDYLKIYKEDPFFGLFWANSFSHLNLNLPSSEDSKMLKLLEVLKSSGTLNSTIVIFLSDHGLRVGEMRQTKIGWFEDRLPFLFISLPEWYKTQNNLHYFNLIQNADRLTSAYDLHSTLNHILHGDKHKRCAGCETCRSLFTEVPRNRSCAEAGIPTHWCACHDIAVSPSVKSVTEMAELVVQAINKQLDGDRDIEIDFVCETLKLMDVLYFREKLGTVKKEYVIGIRTYPGKAEFEATLVGDGSFYRVEKDLSRTNLYKGESKCAKNPRTKELCYCKQINFL